MGGERLGQCRYGGLDTGERERGWEGHGLGGNVERGVGGEGYWG